MIHFYYFYENLAKTLEAVNITNYGRQSNVRRADNSALKYKCDALRHIILTNSMTVYGNITYTVEVDNITNSGIGS